MKRRPELPDVGDQPRDKSWERDLLQISKSVFGNIAALREENSKGLFAEGEEKTFFSSPTSLSKLSLIT
jgi:hypothetical protein